MNDTENQSIKSVIQLNHLTKDYGNGKGIFDVSLEVQKGEIFGFLGPNGAGKTTAIRQLLGFIRPNHGNCTILGMDCFQQASKIQSHLGYLAGEIAFPDDMDGRSLIHFLAEMKNIKKTHRIQELTELFELDLKGKVKKMSKGMKQKIAIINAFMAEPDVVILDEPTSGLDPLMQNRFVVLLLEEKKKGTTIFMSSHIFEEIEKTCDRTAIIRKGRIAAIENMESLSQKKNKKYLIKMESAQELNRFLQSGVSKENTVIDETSIMIPVKGDIQKFLKDISQYQIKDLDIQMQSLEDIFLQYYGEE